MKVIKEEIIKKGIKLTLENEITSKNDKLEAKNQLLENLKRRFENKSKLYSTIIFPTEEEIKQNPPKYYMWEGSLSDDRKFKMIFSFMSIEPFIKYSGNVIKLNGREYR